MRGRAERLVKEAIRRILSDEATARKLGRSLVALQEAKEALDGIGGYAFSVLRLAGRDEWERLSRRIGGVRRRLREAEERLSRVERARAAARSHEKPAEVLRIVR